MRFGAQDLVLNKTYNLTLNQLAIIGASVANALNGPQFGGGGWVQFSNILYCMVPENSELYHAQTIKE